MVAKLHHRLKTICSPHEALRNAGGSECNLPRIPQASCGLQLEGVGGEVVEPAVGVGGFSS